VGKIATLGKLLFTLGWGLLSMTLMGVAAVAVGMPHTARN